MNRTSERIETKLIHAGEPEPKIAGAVAMPIFQSSTFQYEGESGYHNTRYIRMNNTPNHLALHTRSSRRSKIPKRRSLRQAEWRRFLRHYCLCFDPAIIFWLRNAFTVGRSTCSPKIFPAGELRWISLTLTTLRRGPGNFGPTRARFISNP